MNGFWIIDECSFHSTSSISFVFYYTRIKQFKEKKKPHYDRHLNIIQFYQMKNMLAYNKSLEYFLKMIKLTWSEDEITEVQRKRSSFSVILIAQLGINTKLRSRRAYSKYSRTGNLRRAVMTQMQGI